ncbi:glycoside hydrolase family 5 protein [Haploplasma axanthum]|uniref:Endoglucanase A n=1 Tax=Haploplasma axanthum TaxID=29552 RepID=A0A449BF83_HAPAX|nr:glycoside hydrolase family 5 protein [Haploplasma axanthum]VEU81114.1 Endoglucanase A precursor [Haploplasma axanthum]
MKKIIFGFLAIITSLILVGCVSNKTEDRIKKMNAIEVSRDMGNGTNLGNTMEAYGRVEHGIDADTEMYETAWGMPVTTKEMIKGMKEAGFDTIRIPVAWTNMMDYENDNYVINEKLLKRVSEIVNYALDADMYVIVNEHWSGGWWGMFGQPEQSTREKAMTMYTEMWKQISEHFKDYSYKLILESANEELGSRLNDEINEVKGTLTEDETYQVTNKINQKFVDTVRSTGGKNEDRFLLIAGYNTDIEKTIDDRFIMPTDKVEGKQLVSVHYYTPWTYAGDGESKTEWGTKEEYQEMNELFEKMTKFTKKGYGVVFGEFAAIPLKNGTLKGNTLEYIKNVFDNSDLYDFVPLLWDRSDFFDRKELKMKDEGIANLYSSRNVENESKLTIETIKDNARKALDKAVLDAPSGATGFEDKVMAYIMYNSKDYNVGYSNSKGNFYNPNDKTAGVVATDVEVSGAGEYTVSLDFSGVSGGFANSMTFMALGIYNGETNFPNYVIAIKEIKVNSEVVKVTAESYTVSDDKITTRVNIYNTWVTNIPDDARYVKPGLSKLARAVLIDGEKYAELRNVEITFEYIKK